MYIAKKRIKQAIEEYGDEATFENIADYTEYECIELSIKLSEMLSKGQLVKEDGVCTLGG